MMFKVEKPIVVMQKCQHCECFFFSMVEEQKCVDCCVKEIEDGKEERKE